MSFSAFVILGRTALVAAGVAALLAGCTATVPKTLMAEPQLRAVTEQNSTLRALPPPRQPVAVAVYDFPDLTGQFSETITGNQTISHVVTQGGAALLIKALQDAGERHWFTVFDRARLDDTLKERQIVTEMRRIYRGETDISPEALPPLQHAGIILEGGITGYDIYTKTGGVGAQYLGIGGDTKWQQDTVTVNLRAVSTATSEVLASVTVQKSIASISVQGNVFRYVALDKILEAEAGVTANEPKQVAVEKAVEKAVQALILEGAYVRVWKFADAAVGASLVHDYLLEKYDGDVPASALNPAGPVTKNAAQVVTTHPLPREVRPQAPAADAAPAAATSPDAATPPPPDVPPPPKANEVVG